MTALIATDLDRTMIFSRAASGFSTALEERKNALEERLSSPSVLLGSPSVLPGSPSAVEEPVCVEMYDGAPLSYMTRGSVEALTALAASTPVIPTTTRTRAQFERIDLPGGPFRHAVVSNGGRILRDGENDDAWRTALESRVAGTSATVEELHADLRRRVDDSWVRSTRVADDLFVYLVVDLDRQPTDFIDEWRSWCTPRGWSVSQQGRKIYAMPDGVTKSAAVAHIRGRLVDDGTLDADSPVFAAGDGRLDADLLTYADAAIRPAHGELHDSGWTPPGLTVTAASGIEAGAEILAWFADRARSHSSSLHNPDPALAEK
ncbi:hypothetical protein nbrc107696_11540 [Gordonia spumicola]|uniref:HAD family hydrolase n=1 Tax=Gordonia spumicola TaxID=589161 RepID=A0A7I9V5L6_9ACTN|nr:HAD family hydrolase [Gordonia spumicola]GEE00708.1 hypothetical protein nbrc107696_11540 [Gordonia spumicola]